MTEAAERERARKFATVALHRAMDGDLPGAADYVKRLNGSQGLIVAMVGWIDTYIGKIYPDHKDGEPLAIRWLDTNTDEVNDADGVSPTLRWAGRLVAARAAMDEEAFYALLHAPAEGQELGDSIMALLHIVATSLTDPDLIRAKTAELGGAK